MVAAGGSNIGQRKDNEDSYYINMEKGIYVIADGMGGHENGQLASKTAVNHIVMEAETYQDPLTLEQLEKMFQKTNEAVYQYQEALHEGIMGTTLTVVIIQAQKMLIGHVGDSRLYLLRNGKIQQLTLDHSYYAELMRLGKFAEALHKDQKKNVLLKALGPEAKIEGQYLEKEILAHDVLVLCTDGLYNSVMPEEMQKIIEAAEDNLQMAVQQLLSLALDRGATDNLTVILYRHEMH